MLCILFFFYRRNLQEVKQYASEVLKNFYWFCKFLYYGPSETVKKRVEGWGSCNSITFCFVVFLGGAGVENGVSDLDNEATSQEGSSPVVEIFSFCVCPFQTHKHIPAPRCLTILLTLRMCHRTASGVR